MNSECRINKSELVCWVAALREVEQDHKHLEVDMRSTKEPECGTPGCHAGLLYLARKKLGLKLNTKILENERFYNYESEASFFAGRVVFSYANPIDFTFTLAWLAHNNPKWWGNDYGENMFGYGEAFGQTSYNFTASVIVDHWEGVLSRTPQTGKLK